MVQELLPFFPQTLTPQQALLCLVGLFVGIFVWMGASRWSRGLVTLVAVALGALLGMYVPRWQFWPINSMALAVLGAVGFGLSAYLVERLWMGLTLGFVIACWAAMGTWMLQRPPEFVFQQREDWQVQHMTPPERAHDVYIRLPADVQNVLPYAAGTALLSGLAVAFLWPRLGRALGMSALGTTMTAAFALLLVMTQHAEWLQYIPPEPPTQAGILAGMGIVGVLAQWPFIQTRGAKGADGESESSETSQSSPNVTVRAEETPARELARLFS